MVGYLAKSRKISGPFSMTSSHQTMVFCIIDIRKLFKKHFWLSPVCMLMSSYPRNLWDIGRFSGDIWSYSGHVPAKRGWVEYGGHKICFRLQKVMRRISWWLILFRTTTSFVLDLDNSIQLHCYSYIYIYIYIYIYNCWKKSKLKSYVRPWFHG